MADPRPLVIPRMMLNLLHNISNVQVKCQTTFVSLRLGCKSGKNTPGKVKYSIMMAMW